MTGTSIPEALRQLADTGRTGAALFDADGVLWHGDVSEDFARWMVEEGHFDEALWPRYQEVHARDPARGCFEILSFYVGMSKTDIRNCEERFWQTGPERRWLECTMATLRWVEVGRRQGRRELALGSRSPRRDRLRPPTRTRPLGSGGCSPWRGRYAQ